MVRDVMSLFAREPGEGRWHTLAMGAGVRRRAPSGSAARVVRGIRRAKSFLRSQGHVVVTASGMVPVGIFGFFTFILLNCP